MARRASHGWAQRCHAHNRDGAECKHWAMAGQKVCRMHGGAANKERGLRVAELERDKRKLLATISLPDGVDPIDLILGQIGQAAALSEVYRSWVDDLPDAQITEIGPGGALKQVIHPKVALWNEERDRLVSWCEKALRIGIDAERVRIARHHGERITGAILAALADREWSLTEDQQQRGRTVIARHLRLADVG